MKEIGLIGVLAGIVWGIQNFLITYAFQKTAAANVLVIVAANPMFSAILSYFLLNEKAPVRTILASIVR